MQGWPRAYRSGSSGFFVLSALSSMKVMEMPGMLTTFLSMSISLGQYCFQVFSKTSMNEMMLAKLEILSQSVIIVQPRLENSDKNLLYSSCIMVGLPLIFEIWELKPGSGQEHMHIVLLCNIDITHVGQHSYKVLLYQVEVVLSTVQAKYKNLVYPSHPPISDSFRQAVYVFHGTCVPNPLGDDFLPMGKFFDK